MNEQQPVMKQKPGANGQRQSGMNMPQQRMKRQSKMNEQQQQVWTLASRLTSVTVLLGIAAFVASFFASGSSMREYLMFGGIGLAVAACFLFALGLIFMLMLEAAGGHEHAEKQAVSS
ncbi:hypothetical protein DUZ99_12210 [Xylanibacillus composti]|uniref:Uncharacterized protein n=1 Tax=Xylanibacillus composti TaxID=1572762 RepID=A0A8J4H8S8_9BACL|nr:hypothetical protein [Xylanibacillus composti]MDT9725738.1 hypothetical protein [Xylanibacillus composti]GIQ71123.1 hypothetical protein XYCOK13_39470 [Xylanibacillus composti]